MLRGTLKEALLDHPRLESVAMTLLLVWFVSLLSSTDYAPEASPSLSGVPPAVLMISKEDLNCGVVWADANFERELIVCNESAEDIVVDDVVSSCSCASISPASFTVRAHGNAIFRVRIDLVRIIASAIDANDDVPFTVRLMPVFKTSGAHPGWQVRGKARRTIRVLPSSIKFEDEIVRGTKYPKMCARVVSLLTAKSVTAACDSTTADVRLNPSRTDGELELSVSFSDNVQEGLQEFDIVITLVSLDNSHVYTTRVPVAARVVDDIGSSPATLQLGIVDVGEQILRNVNLRSHTNRDFYVVQATSSSDDVSVSQEKPGHFSVKVNVFEYGTKSAYISFIVRVKGTENDFKCDVPVYWHGTRARRH